jgi:hypothetical protein
MQLETALVTRENRSSPLTNGTARNYGKAIDQVRDIKTLSLQEMPDAIQAVLKKPLGQRGAGFKEIVAAVHRDDIAKAVAILNTFPNYEARTKLRSLFLRRWAESDPKAAASVAEATTGGENRKEAMLAVAKGWAETNLDSAVAWVKNLPVSQIRNTMLQSIAAQLAESDPRKAATMAFELPGRFQIFATEQVAEKWAQTDPDGAMEWVQSLPAGQAQTRALTAVSKMLADANPQYAADMVNLLPQANRSQFLEYIAHSWAQNDLSAAIEWAQKIEGRDREVALRGVCEQWTESDPKAAANFMQQSRPDLLASIGMTWGRNDPNAALEWADQLADKKQQESVYVSIMAGWALNAPADAANFVAKLPAGDLQNSAAKAIVSRWAENDPATAASWASNFPEGQTRQVAFQDIVLQWGKIDPDAAATWLNTLPTGGSRDTAIVTFANDCLRNYNPSAALAWARTITNDGVRNNIVKSIEIEISHQ